jgi:hypothetical protein
VTGSSRVTQWGGACYGRDPATSRGDEPAAGRGSGVLAGCHDRLQRPIGTGRPNSGRRGYPQRHAQSPERLHAVGVADRQRNRSGHRKADCEANGKAGDSPTGNKTAGAVETPDHPRRMPGLPEQQPVEPEYRERPGQSDVRELHRRDRCDQTIPAS